MAELLVVATTAALDARDLVRALERAAPAGVTAASAPGLLAPAAGDRALHRDAARARGAVVLVLAPGGPDLANHALLTIEAARAAGLAVPAVIVAGPGGAGQRDLLAAHARADVVGLDDLQAPSAAVAGWPLDAWAAAEPLAADGGIALAPYGAWEERPVPDPRSAGRDAVDPVLLEIVQAEGPVLAGRAYRLYVKASGGKALTSVARAPLSGSVYRLRQQGRLEISGAAENPGQDDEVLRIAGTPPVRLRELGPRALDEVPLAEIAELMDRLRAAGIAEDDLPRRVLDTYGLVRMTAKAETYLATARGWAARED